MLEKNYKNETLLVAVSEGGFIIMMAIGPAFCVKQK
jgi:hypothetical protein